MNLLKRYIYDQRGLWRIWVPLLVLSLLTPFTAIAIPLLERRIIDEVVLAKRMDLLLTTGSLYGGIWLVNWLLVVSGSVLRTYFNERTMLELRERVFAHSQRLSLSFARQEHSGRIMSLFVNDIPSLGSLFSSTVIGGVGSVFTIVVSAVLMFALSPEIALAAALGPPILMLIAGLVTRPLRPAARRVQETAAVMNERLQENLTGIREVVAFGQEANTARVVHASMLDLLRMRMRIAYMDTALSAGGSFFSLAVTMTILVYGSYLVIGDQTTLGTVVAMRTLYNYVYSPASRLFGMVGGTQKALGAADRVYGLLDHQPDVVDLPGAAPPVNVTGQVVFDDVTFGYGRGQAVLQNISFTAEPGQVIALVGPSGAGKTTLVNLIARFYDPDEGRVLLDGIDVRELTVHGLRNAIAMVFQDTFLFSATIRENIAFGRPDAAEAEIIAAARASNAWEFIQCLPNGLDTVVGERGVQFSEGQKQRLAIARALLRDPRVLILDEPTSALDARSEHLLQSAFDNLMRGRTTFVVAHRLATVRRADRILVLEDGRIVDAGSHRELLERDGLYRELHDLQFTADEREDRLGILEHEHSSPVSLLSVP